MSVLVKKRHMADVRRARKFARRINRTVNFQASVRSYDADFHCVFVYKAEEPQTLRLDWSPTN